MVAILSETGLASTPEARPAPAFNVRRAVGRAVEGALSVGVLGMATGGVLTEFAFGIPYTTTLQWTCALIGSLAGAIWGAASKGLPR